MSSRVVLVVADRSDPGGWAAARAAASPVPGGPVPGGTVPGGTVPGGTDSGGTDSGGSGSAATVVAVTGDDLAAARWSHHVASDGRARTTIRLGGPRGPVLGDEGIATVLFRAQAWRVPVGLREAPAGDVSYAWAELTALFVSWLASLGPKVVNTVEGGSPVGPSWSSARWRQLAAEAGLQARDEDAVRAVLVAGEQVIGSQGHAESLGCRRLAASAGCRLLEVWFTASGEVCTASPTPSLTDPAHVAATTALLTRGAA